MTIPTLTRSQAQLLDRRAIDQYGIPGLLLMENAGRGVVDTLESLGIGGPVVVCCGKGNNAGDGFVIARHLDLRGHRVRVLLWADPSSLSGDAATNFRILHKARIPIQRLGRLPCADQVEAALDVLTSIGDPANVAVTGPVGGPWVVDFLGGLSNTDLLPLVAASASIRVVPALPVVSWARHSGLASNNKTSPSQRNCAPAFLTEVFIKEPLYR